MKTQPHSLSPATGNAGDKIFCYALLRMAFPYRSEHRKVLQFDNCVGVSGIEKLSSTYINLIKRCLAIIILLASFKASLLQAQDIPLFSQKLTNSFMYNPALAGHTFGSVTFSYRNNYSGVKDAPNSKFISMHAPFANYRFGAGFNVFQEDVGILRNTYMSAAFAYHLRFNKLSILSFGVSGEYNTIRLNSSGLNFGQIQSDDVINRITDGINTPDFSFGAHYQYRYFKVGLAANRLSTAWLSPDNKKELSNYYSGYAQGLIPFRDGQDLLEPYVAFRKFSETSDTYDIGLYYTYDNKITFGAATRRGNIINASLGYRLNKLLLVAYSREMILGGVGGFVGSSNEFTIRIDFRDQSYQQNFKADYKSAMTYRRKTLNSSSVKKTSGGRSPKELAKAQKRVAAFSPNDRYQNTKKLSQGKKSYTGKSSNKKKPNTSRKKSGSKRRK